MKLTLPGNIHTHLVINKLLNDHFENFMKPPWLRYYPPTMDNDGKETIELTFIHDSDLVYFSLIYNGQ